MPTTTSHLPPEFFAFYGQLSEKQQDELFAHLRQMVRDNQQSKEQTQDDALEKFIGCLAGRQTIEEMTTDDALERLKGCAKGAVDKPLTIEEMNEIAAAGWAGEYK